MRSPVSSALLAVASFVFALTGCVAASEPFTTCASTTDCPSGYMCIDRLCQLAASTPRPDSGIAVNDTGPYSQPDAVITGGYDAQPDSNGAGPGSGSPGGGSPGSGGPGTGGACSPGANEPCTTSCGTTGSRSCTSLGWSLCAPPSETCNGVDDDCDGMADEAVQRTCNNACGAGVETCVGGAFQACTARTPTEETCNGIDDDCDGVADDNVTRACTTMCGAGVEMCSGGMFGGCTGARTPSTETCNNVDDDCNGTVDDGLRRNCSTACGAGEEVCSGGAFGACSARTPTGESCNRVDDDCNGTVDDGLRAALTNPTHAQLQSFHPDCTPANAGTIFCNSAANRYCNTTCSGRSGLLVEDDGTNTVTMCIGVDHVGTTFGALAGRHPSCTFANHSTIFCASATHRECQARGYASGIGLLETDGTNVTIACMRGFDGSQATPTARTAVINTGFSRLDDFIPACTQAAASSFSCRAAAHRLCNAGGYRSGFGPVEASGDSATIICVNP